MKHIFIAFIAFILTISASQSFASKRIALVIGNGEYNIKQGKLNNPPRDAASIAEALRGLGFEVTLKTNLKNREAMEVSVEEFSNKLQEKEMGLFYYAGHAAQLDDKNYLIPTTAKINKASDYRHRAMDVSFVLESMGAANPHQNIVILDSCRDNPFPKPSRGASRGMGIIEPPSDMIIAFATKANDTADDGDDLHSPYTQALLTNIKVAAHLPVFELFNRVAIDVLKRTENDQEPQLKISPLNYQYCLGVCADKLVSPLIIDQIQPLIPAVQAPIKTTVEAMVEPIMAIPTSTQSKSLLDNMTEHQWLLFILPAGLLLMTVTFYYLRRPAAPANVVAYQIHEPSPGNSPTQAQSLYQPDILPDLSAFSGGQALAYICRLSDNQAVAALNPGEPTLMGRSSHMDVRLEDTAVSAKHARLSWHGGSGSFILEDLGSTNGTWLEGEAPLSSGVKATLNGGEIFYLGNKAGAFWLYRPENKA